ncbi:hypothetical protein KUTeg_000260, partial [Tegillarca granosa]
MSEAGDLNDNHHSECLRKVLKMDELSDSCSGKKRKIEDQLTETDVTTVFAEHLLKRLAPESSYVICSRSSNKRQYCECGCKALITYGDTGIGKHKMIIICNFLYDNEGITINTSDGIQIIPIQLEFYKQSYQEFNNHSIPTLVLSRKTFRIIIYDAKNDILFRSKMIPVFNGNSLSVRAIIVLWLVLHYRVFSSDIMLEKICVDKNIIKSGFVDLLLEDPEKYDIYNHKLKEFVASFDTVDACCICDDKQYDKFAMPII